jgi:hypothetical protein
MAKIVGGNVQQGIFIGNGYRRCTVDRLLHPEESTAIVTGVDPAAKPCIATVLIVCKFQLP